MEPIVAHASGRILRSVIAPIDRETFDRAQRRNRRDARIRAIPAVLAAAAIGIPLGVYLSPVLIALAIRRSGTLTWQRMMPSWMSNPRHLPGS
jgi:hypothetical protein